MNSTEVTEIFQLVLRERQGRDRGWWTQMADCFHPDSSVYLSWFSGTGPEFVAASKGRFAAGTHPLHRMAPPVVHRNANRAVAEVPAAIEVRSVVDGTEIDLVSYTRLLYQVEKTETRWLIRALTCIYERDTFTPVLPGATVTVDPDRLAQIRMPFRYLGYFFGLRGGSIDPNLYGDDQPERLEGLYDATFRWMHGTGPG